MITAAYFCCLIFVLLILAELLTRLAQRLYERRETPEQRVYRDQLTKEQPR